MLEGYEIAWRPNYEKLQTAIWVFFGGLTLSLPLVSDIPKQPAQYFATACVLMACYRAFPAIKNAQRLMHLQKILMDYVPRRKIIKITAKKLKTEDLWLGWGFDWDTSHAQLAFDLIKRDPTKFAGAAAKKHAGAAWLHGLSKVEKEIDAPLSMFDGMAIIIGTTGAGKTRLLDLVITQAIARGEPVIVLDPKGDAELWKGMKRTCEEIGHPERFVYFHPGFPEKSARIDPLANFSRATELASRISMLIQADGAGQTFKDYSQMALTKVITGIMYSGEKPNLLQIKRYLELGVDGLLQKVMEKYFREKVPNWRDEVRASVAKCKGDLTEGYVHYYQNFCMQLSPAPDLEGLIDLFHHDRVHFGKMITSLMPTLTALTSGDMGELLSPDKMTVDDRIITDSASMIRNSQAVYIGLDDLSDNITGTAVGSILLSEITSVAGARYNYSDGKGKPVNLIVDELSAIVNQPMISLLSRGRGAKIRVICATQTVADLSAKLGSEDRARQVLANCNNVIALRTPEPKTQQYLTESLPKTVVKHIMQTQGTNTDAEVPLVFSGTFGERLMETEKEIFSPEYLGLLPNFHYLARLTGGRLIKGRLPFITDEQNDDELVSYEHKDPTSTHLIHKELIDGASDSLPSPDWRFANYSDNEEEEGPGRRNIIG